MTDRRKILAAHKAMASASGAPMASGGYGNSAAAMANSYDSQGWAHAYGQFSAGLPRPADTFTNGAFGPLSPILPNPVNNPPEGSDFAEPRLFENQVGWNLPVGTPGAEGVKLADFSTLKTLADLYSVARACIQLRKNEVRGIEWDILPTRDASKAMRGSPNLARSFGARRSEAIKFFKRPDPDYFNWSSFLDALSEEVFVYDALSLLIRPKWAKGRGQGLLGSDLDSLSLLSGPTIRPLLGLHAERPRPPAPAYQQYLYGVPRVDLMSMVTERDLEDGRLTGAEMGQFKADQLLYLPMVPRRWTPYGFPPIERALIPVMAGLQKQGYQLDFFKEGSIPAVYISPGGSNANMTPNQIRELQDALNALAGDVAQKHRVIVLPADSKVMPQKQAQLADQFDEIVMNQVTMAFDVQPMELGIMPKVSTTVSPGACYAEGTQILTKRGWLDFSEVSVGPNGDDFATRAMGSKLFEWQKATEYFEYEHDGEAVRFSSTNGAQDKEGGFQLLVSPNHRMLIDDAGAKKKDGSRPRVEYIREAGSIGAKRVCIPLRSEWQGSGPQTVRFDGFEWSAVDFAAFLGAYLAEGNGEKNTNRFSIAQMEFSKGFEPYKELLGRMFGDKLRYNGRLFRVTAPELREYLRPLGLTHEKYIPRDVLDWSATALRALLDHYLLGDGWLENGHWRARTVSKELADDLQEVAQKLGLYMTITEHQPKDNMIQGRVVKAENCRTDYILRFGERRTRSALVSRETYTGVMRCVSVPNGIVYVRNGKCAVPAWCGNSNQMSKASQSIHQRKATVPFLAFISDIMNVILQDVCGQTDMRFMFEGLEEGEDEEVKTNILISQVGSALRSIDEAREELDLQPWGLPETSDPGWATATGWTPLTEAIAASRTGQNEGAIFDTDAYTPGAPGSTTPPVGQQPGSPAAPGSPADASPTGGVELSSATPGHAAAEAAGSTNSLEVPAQMSGKSEDAKLFKQSGDDFVQRRAKRVSKNQDKVESQLEQLVDGLRAGKIDRNNGVALGISFLAAGYKAVIDKAIEDAASDLDLNYVKHNAVDNLAWQYSESQRMWLDGLIKKALADPDKKLSGRIGIYAQTLEAVYNKSYADAAESSGQDWRITWHTDRNENCQLCKDRDGGQFTWSTLPGIPGEGVFGGDLCKGGPNCHCYLEFKKMDAKDVRTTPFDDQGFESHDAEALNERTAAFANNRTLAEGKHPAEVMTPEEVGDKDAVATMASKTRAILSELESMARHVKKGRLVSDWEPRHLSQEVLARINEYMAKGADVDTAVQMVRQQRVVDSAGQVFWKDLLGGERPGQLAPGIGGGYEAQSHDVNDIRFKPKGAVADLSDPNTVDAEHIVNMMMADFPVKSLKWIPDAQWIGPVEVPIERVDFDDVDSWAASHEPERVAHFVQMLKKGKRMKPGISVRQTEGDSRIKIVDGHHRILAYRELGIPYVTYLGFVPEGDDRWEQTHSYQFMKEKNPSASATAAKQATMSKAEADYRPSDSFSERCGTCSMFLPGKNACTLVKGRIKPNDVCDEWEPADKADKQIQPAVVGPTVGRGAPTPARPVAATDPSALQTEEDMMDDPMLIEFFETGAGGAQIKWGTTGDISRCVSLATQSMGLENAQTFCQARYSKMTGQTPSGLIHQAPSS